MTGVSQSLLRWSSIAIALSLDLTLATFPACGFGSRDPKAVVDLPTNPTWTDGISDLMAAYCDDCHGEIPSDRSLAYFRTDIYGRSGSAEGAFDMSDRLLARVEDTRLPMPPPPDRPLSPAEVEALADWVARGAPYDGSRGTAGIGAPSCAAGSVTDCACPDGHYGEQLCRMDGMFAPCECEVTASPSPGSGGGDQTGGGGDAGTTPGQPTLRDVWSEVLVPSCAALGCHIPGAAYPDLQTQTGLADLLLQPSRQERGMALVSPGFLEGSYLYVKTRDDFTSQGIGSGARMPPALPLGAEQRALLESWIIAGAPP